MNKEQIRQALSQHIADALASLKDFQRATVDTVYQQMYQENQRCMLVADEVGLGKTIVAKGIIARRIQSRIINQEHRPLRVTYICSNQVIARENIRKLNLFPEDIHINKPVSRITFLARKPQARIDPGKVKQNLLELHSLTPATSFEVSNSLGNRHERTIIYALLCQGDRRMYSRYHGLLWMLKGAVSKMKRFKYKMEWHAQYGEYRTGLARRFVRKLKSIKLSEEDALINEHLGPRRLRTLYEAVIEYGEQVNRQTERRMHRGCVQLTRKLRKALIECCLTYVNADIYILDEFQRFSDLIDLDNQEERALIARRIFESRPESRVLLLSATPFKAFTNHDDFDRGEDHYQDFRRVLRFLLEKQHPERLEEYDAARKHLYSQLLELRKGQVNMDTAARDIVQGVLRTVICRTERNSVAENPEVMIDDQWKKPLVISQGDIANYQQTDQIYRQLQGLQAWSGKPTEFCKSAVFPFSFLDRYKVKKTLRENKHQQGLRDCLKKHPNAWLNFKSINNYSWACANGESTAPTNARINQLVDKAIDQRGAEMLWVPPSLPYYPLEECYADAEHFSKTLVFSSWVMVPRVIGTLLSYEVERRTVGSSKTIEGESQDERTYFVEAGKQRAPYRQFNFVDSGAGPARMKNMTNFCLLYPSLSLADGVDLAANTKKQDTLDAIKLKLAETIGRKIKAANLEQYCVSGGSSDRWYWAAPLLLDRAQEKYKPTLESWFWDDEQPDHAPWGRKTYFRETRESAGKEDHFEFFRQCFENPTDAQLGAIPKDLPQVLAELAVGSPAILALRSLQRIFPDHAPARCMVAAFDVADEFINLFNKPESIAAVRLNVEKMRYWQRVARYCAAGCLQSVFDEYFHVLKGQYADPRGAISQLLASINLGTVSISVDDLESFQTNRPKKLRCHYAVEFGSQRVETEEGEQRAASLREVFNSPFRPFVLATTSIGQEGLDFHAYCRRIVHWNLPGNPIDLEQREGRINRYKGLVIRQHLAEKYASRIESTAGDIWDTVFQLADQHERKAKDKCELVPYWHADTDQVKIERVIPLYPYSRDQARLAKILKTLAVYRLAFGQPRQAELVEHLLSHKFTSEEIDAIKERLMVDLSPINYRDGDVEVITDIKPEQFDGWFEILAGEGEQADSKSGATRKRRGRKTAAKRKHRSKEQMQQLAEERGVGQIYSEVFGRLISIFDEVELLVSTVSYNCKAFENGKLRRLNMMAVYVGSSSAEKGLDMQVMVDRISRHFDLPVDDLVAVLPQNAVKRFFDRDNAGHQYQFVVRNQEQLEEYFELLASHKPQTQSQ